MAATGHRDQSRNGDPVVLITTTGGSHDLSRTTSRGTDHRPVLAVPDPGRGAVISERRVVDTDQPLSRVACFLSDFSSTEQWDPHTIRCRQLSDGPTLLGREYENSQRIGPLRTTLRYRVVDWAPEHHVELHSSSRRLEATDRMEFAAIGGGTRVTYTATLRLKGAARLTAPVLRWILRRVADDGENGMRGALQRLPAAAPFDTAVPAPE